MNGLTRSTSRCVSWGSPYNQDINMQHILNTIMSTADLLKIIMLVGIIFALLASRWISKQTAILAEENRRADQKIDYLEDRSTPPGRRARADA
ncbi:hypothetical protein [Hydrogenophaga sp.]|jgi:hypothetical protein|uniref:hypothetical protein n=2 Tax=Hydrogenophaga sp. TaxID=1904254 RepID=UPI003AF5118B